MKLLTKSYTYKIAIEFGTLWSLAKVKINIFSKDKIFILIRAVKKNHCKILLLPNNLIILVKNNSLWYYPSKSIMTSLGYGKKIIPALSGDKQIV